MKTRYTRAVTAAAASPRAAPWLAWLSCGLVLAMVAGAVALAGANRYEALSLVFLAAEVMAALAGGLVASRRPGNLVGWLILGHALCFSLGEFARQYAVYGLLTEPGSLPLAGAAASVPYWIWFPGVLLIFAFFPLYFPDGRLLSPRWRPVALCAVFVTGALTGLAAVQPGDHETPGIPNPLGVEGLGSTGWEVGYLVPLVWLGLGALSAASLVLRFRCSRGEERQQIKWVVYAVVLLVLWSTLDSLLFADLTSVASEAASVLVLGSLWVSIGIAVLRYRLYDIDVIINRTLVYGALTAMLALTYLGSVALLQGVFRALTESESQLAVVASTLAIAAMFVPLRRRIQRLIDRRFYRRKYDARRTLAAFSARLRQDRDLDSLEGELVGAVRETLEPEHAALWLRPVEPVDRDPGERMARG